MENHIFIFHTVKRVVLTSIQKYAKEKIYHIVSIMACIKKLKKDDIKTKRRKL